MISFGYYYFSLNVRQKLFTDEDDRIHSVIGIPFKYDSDKLPEQTFMEGTDFHCLNPPQGFVRTVVHRQRFLT